MAPVRMLAGAALVAVAIAGAVVAQTADTAAPPQDDPHPKPRLAEIRWPEAIKMAAAEKRGILAMQRAEIDQTVIDKLTLPLMLPDDPRIDRAMRVFAQTNTYAATAREEGALIEIVGTRVALAAPEQSPLSRARKALTPPGGLRVERTDYGVEISFTRFGAAYNLSILCDDPVTDERCRKDDYAREIAESLVVVIGSRGAQKP